MVRRRTREPENEQNGGGQPAPPAGKQSRRRLQLTKAEWDRVHELNVRSEREPDPAQLPLLGDD
jgi:hypothetical protein